VPSDVDLQGIDYAEDDENESTYGTPTCAHCQCGIPSEREDECPKCKRSIHILCAHTCPSVDGVEWPGGGPLDFATPKRT